MQTGIFLLPSDARTVGEEVRAAERCGFDFAGLADTQALLHEVHTTLGAVAGDVESMEIGPLVTNPVTRHPSVTASALCTLDELTDGNAVLGLGTGDTAVRLVGERPATLDELADFVAEFRALCGGRPVDYGSTEGTIRWVDRVDGGPSIPVAVTAEGPKTLERAGRVADRVVIANGLTESTVETAVARIERGARSAGRDPGSVEKILWGRCLPTAPDDDQFEQLQLNVAGTSNHAFESPLARRNAPEAYHDALATLVADYDKEHHLGLSSEDRTNLDLLRGLDDRYPGFTEYLVERFYVVGPPATCAERFDSILAATDLDGVYFNVVDIGREHPIERFSDEVVGCMRSV